MSLRIACASCRAVHSASERSRYFSVTISRIGPTFCAMPPCTSTRLSCSFRRVSAEASAASSTWWVGSRRPRLMPNSGSPSAAACPWISLMPGQTPPESCQPPPEPAIHSPRIARAATSRRSVSCSPPSRFCACPVARMQTEISEASRLVETARREPFGMPLTLLISSMPAPRPRQPRQQIGQMLLRALRCPAAPAPTRSAPLSAAPDSRARSRTPRSAP